MAEPTQFLLTHRHLVELIIKDAGVHDGRWMLAVSFGLAPGNFGPSEDQLSPGAVVAINQIGIQRLVGDAAAPSSLVVDAALVNPARQAEKGVHKRRKEPQS